MNSLIFLFFCLLQISRIAFETAVASIAVVGGAECGTGIPAAPGVFIGGAAVSVRRSESRWSLSGNGSRRTVTGSLPGPPG